MDILRIPQVTPPCLRTGKKCKGLAKQRRNQEALDALDTAERLNPRFAITYVYRGKLYEQSGDRAAAAREYQRALAIEPANAEALEGLRHVGP